MTGQSLTPALEAASAISDQDRAFVHMLSYGVCRQYFLLEQILTQLLVKPVKEADLQALLLVGLYQLQFMRVKPHAAVSETVAAVGNRKWAKGLVNGVLRNFLRDSEQLAQQALSNDQAAFNHPAWLLRQIRQAWPEQAAAVLAANNTHPVMALRVNLGAIGREAYQAQLDAANLTAQTVAFAPAALQLDQAVATSQLPGFAAGQVSVQDTAAQLAAYLLATQPGDRVLDVCAAPGGKTAHILENQPQLKELVAVDIDAQRLAKVAENLARLQKSAKLIHADASDTATWWDGQPFERILLDAPCSATGVIRRHPDIKLLRRESDIPALQDLQQALLEAIWPLLAPGGTLLYATCSILPQENANQLHTFLAHHGDAEEWPINADWGLAQTVGRQILTGEAGMDGFYYARLRKT